MFIKYIAKYITNNLINKLKYVEAAERKAFELAIDKVLKDINNNPQEGLLKIVDLTEKMMGGKEGYKK